MVSGVFLVQEHKEGNYQLGKYSALISKSSLLQHASRLCSLLRSMCFKDKVEHDNLMTTFYFSPPLPALSLSTKNPCNVPGNSNKTKQELNDASERQVARSQFAVTLGVQIRLSIRLKKTTCSQWNKCNSKTTGWMC